jgi:hypothetical protein
MKDYPFKLGEWIDEPVEITTVDPVLNARGAVVGMKEGKRTVMQRTHYTELSEPLRMSCNDLHHNWTIPDPHQHVAHCSKCRKKQLIRAVYERVVDGQILDRDTGQPIA